MNQSKSENRYGLSALGGCLGGVRESHGEALAHAEAAGSTEKMTSIQALGEIPSNTAPAVIQSPPSYDLMAQTALPFNQTVSKSSVSHSPELPTRLR